MANLVEVIVKVNGDTVGPELAKIEGETKSSADRQQSTWDKLGSGIKARMGSVLGGGGLFAGGAAGLGMTGPLAAAGLAVTAFAAVAKPELTKVQAAMSKTGAAGQKAWAQLTPGEQTLGRSIKGFETAFHGVQAALQPVIDKTVALAAHLGKDLLPALEPLARGGAKFIDGLLTPLDKLVSSPFFAQFAQQMGKLAAQAGSVLGPALVQLLKVFMQLFMQAGPAGLQVLGALLTALVQLVGALVPVIVPITGIVAAILKFLTATHLLIPVLGIAAAAFLILASGSGILAVTIAIAVLVAAISYMAHHWTAIWNGIKHVTDDAISFIKKMFDDAVNFIRDHWKVILPILTGPIGLAVVWIISHWRQITSFFGSAVHLIASAWSAVEHAIVSPVMSAYHTVLGIVHAIGSALSSVASMVNNMLGGLPGKALGFLGFAHGGVIGAATGGPRSGLTMVGEHGREMVKLPAGSTVMSNPDTEAAMSGGGSGGGPQEVMLSWQGGGGDLWEFLRKGLRGHIRKRFGGSAQTALGA